MDRTRSITTVAPERVRAALVAFVAGGSASRLRRRRWLVGGLLAALAVAATGSGYLLGATRARDAVRVERLTDVHGLEAPAWADGDVFVSTHSGLVRIAANGGWYEVGDLRHDLMGFRAHPTDAAVLYGSGHPDLRSGLKNPVGFVRSADAGVSWESVALAGQAEFHALAVQATNGDVLYGFGVDSAPGLYRTVDGGATWARVRAEALLDAGGATVLEVDPFDADVVYAGTPRGLLRSVDGGGTWESFAFDGVAVTAVRFSAVEPRAILVYVADAEVGLTASVDGGDSWAPLGLVVQGSDAVGYIAPSPTDKNTMHVGTYGMDVMVTSDGGDTWTLLAERGAVLGEMR